MTQPMKRLDCELCGQRPLEGLVPLRPNHQVCIPCRELVLLGVRMVRKHGRDHVRELIYEMVEEAWRADAD